jgi:hypothetical protein
MKSQIALIGIGLAIAAGVAYAELKPASITPSAPVVSTPEPAASPMETKGATTVKTPAPKKSLVPTIPMPTISGGNDDDNDDNDENDENDENERDDEDDED